MVSGPDAVKYSLPMSEPWRHWTLDLNSEAGRRTYCNELSAVQRPWFRSIEEKFSFYQMQDEEPHICYTRLEQVDLLEPVCATKKVLIFIADLIQFPTHPILCRNTQYYHPKDLWQRFWQSVFFFYILFLFLTEPLFFALPNKIPPLLLFHNSAQFRTISQPNSFLNSKFCNGKN